MEQGSGNLFENNVFANMPEGVRPGGLVLTQRLVKCCNFQRGELIIDIGCGTGTTVEYLRDVHKLYAIGVDLSVELLQRGKERMADLQLMHSPAEELPFANQSVDGVLAECSLSVMSDVGRVLEEINRVLIPGGKIGITDLYNRGTITDFLTGDSASSMAYGEMIETLQDHGFKILVVEDQSKFLRQFIASFIMEHGSTEELWQCAKIDQKAYKLGYYLLIAEKCS